MDTAKHAGEQRDAVPEREQAHVQQHILEPVQKEDDADEKEQVVVSGHHVFGAQVHERADRLSLKPLQEHRVLPRHAVRFEAYRTGARNGNERRECDPIPTDADTWHGSYHTLH